MRFRPERALECRVGERCPIPKTSSAVPARAVQSSDGSSIRRSATNCFKELTPRYGKVVADHVTLAANVDRDTPLPEAVTAEAIGHIDDDRGVEALVVAIAGSTDRPDGSIYHITWSLGPGRRAKESNNVLANGPWRPLREPIPLSLSPARWP